MLNIEQYIRDKEKEIEQTELDQKQIMDTINEDSARIARLVISWMLNKDNYNYDINEKSSKAVLASALMDVFTLFMSGISSMNNDELNGQSEMEELFAKLPKRKGLIMAVAIFETLAESVKNKLNDDLAKEALKQA